MRRAGAAVGGSVIAVAAVQRGRDSNDASSQYRSESNARGRRTWEINGRHMAVYRTRSMAYSYCTCG